MDHLKKFGVALLAALAMSLVGDIYFSFFGSQITGVFASHFSDGELPGLTHIQFFTVWFFINVWFTTILANQWVLSVDNTHPEPRSTTVTRRAYLLLMYKGVAGPALLGAAHILVRLLPPPWG